MRFLFLLGVLVHGAVCHYSEETREEAILLLRGTDEDVIRAIVRDYIQPSRRVPQIIKNLLTNRDATHGLLTDMLFNRRVIDWVIDEILNDWEKSEEEKSVIAPRNNNLFRKAANKIISQNKVIRALQNPPKYSFDKEFEVFGGGQWRNVESDSEDVD